MTGKKQKIKSFESLRFQLSEAQYNQFMQEIKKRGKNPELMLQFLMERYLGRDGTDGNS